MKRIGTIKNLSKTLARHSLATIYLWEIFARPYLDYGYMIFDQSNSETFNQKMERIEYNAILAITCAIQETFQSKLCGELGLESLKCGRWFRKLVNLLWN